MISFFQSQMTCTSLALMDLGSMLGSAKYLIITIGATLLMLGVIIALHELGHLLMARMCGVAVEAYSIGFGKKLFARKWGETEYQLRMLPLGGFAKVHGMFDETAAMGPEDEDAPDFGPTRKFDNKNIFVKVLILAGGALFNFITAYLIFFAAAMGGQIGPSLMDLPPVIEVISPDGPAAQAGMAPGDLILAMDGSPVASIRDASLHLMLNSLKPYPVEVQRKGDRLTFEVTPEKIEIEGNVMGDLGLTLNIPVQVGQVNQDMPAGKMGLKRGDRIVAINEVPTLSWGIFQQELSKQGGSEIRLEVSRDGEHLTLVGTPKKNDKENQPYLLGFNLGSTEPVTAKAAAGIAFTELKGGSTLIFQFLGKLISRKASMTTMSGPIGIGAVVGKQANSGQGLWPLIMMAGMISLQLGVFNLLPIPALDGGHIFVVLIEAIRRKAISPENKIRIIQFGFLIMLSLFAVVIVMDVVKIIKTRSQANSEVPAVSTKP